MEWISLLTAFAGGAFGAAIGALPAFIFCGIALLVGIAIALAGGDTGFLDIVANGPIFGPHVAFAGGVAGAAYAARRGQIPNGKDIAFALAELGKPGALIVGGLFGAVGQLIVSTLGPTLDSYTNTSAAAVIFLGIVARLAFGSSGLFGEMPRGTTLRRRFAPTAAEAWVPHQRKLSQAALLGIVAGLLASYAALTLADLYPEAASATVSVGFALSATSLIFAALGKGVPVTHHMTLTSAVAASLTGSLFVGAVVGGLAGLLGEFWARAMQNHGDTHIDPPGNTIWSLTAVVLAVNALTQSL